MKWDTYSYIVITYIFIRYKRKESDLNYQIEVAVGWPCLSLVDRRLEEGNRVRIDVDDGESGVIAQQGRGLYVQQSVDCNKLNRTAFVYVYLMQTYCHYIQICFYLMRLKNCCIIETRFCVNVLTMFYIITYVT